MSENDVKLADELAAVHEKLYALAQAARLAESYHRAKNAGRLAAALTKADQLAEVPFALHLEAALSRLENVKGVLDIPGSGGASASSYTQLMVAVWRRVRNTIVERYLPQLGDIELAASDPIPGSDYPVVVIPLGVTWEQIAKLMVADTGMALIMAGWRVACERLVLKLKEDADGVEFEGVWADMQGVRIDTSEEAEMLADMMDTGWRPEPEEAPRRTRGPAEVNAAAYPILGRRFGPNTTPAQIICAIAEDEELRGDLRAAGVPVRNAEKVQKLAESHVRWARRQRQQEHDEQRRAA